MAAQFAFYRNTKPPSAGQPKAVCFVTQENRQAGLTAVMRALKMRGMPS